MAKFRCSTTTRKKSSTHPFEHPSGCFFVASVVHPAHNGRPANEQVGFFGVLLSRMKTPDPEQQDVLLWFLRQGFHAAVQQIKICPLFHGDVFTFKAQVVCKNRDLWHRLMLWAGLP